MDNASIRDACVAINHSECHDKLIRTVWVAPRYVLSAG